MTVIVENWIMKKENTLVLMVFIIGIGLLLYGIKSYIFLYIGGLVIAIDYVLHTTYRINTQQGYKKRAAKTVRLLQERIPNYSEKTKAWESILNFFDLVLETTKQYENDTIRYMAEMEINKKLRDNIFSEKPRPHIDEEVFQNFLSPTFKIDFYLPQKYYSKALEGIAELIWVLNKMEYDPTIDKVIFPPSKNEKVLTWKKFYDIIEWDEEKDLRRNIQVIFENFEDENIRVNELKETKQNKIVYLFLKSFVNILSLLWESPIYLNTKKTTDIKDKWIEFQNEIISSRNPVDISKSYGKLLDSTRSYCQIEELKY